MTIPPRTAEFLAKHNLQLIFFKSEDRRPFKCDVAAVTRPKKKHSLVKTKINSVVLVGYGADKERALLNLNALVEKYGHEGPESDTPTASPLNRPQV
jgi:hypothetical protein